MEKYLLYFYKILLLSAVLFSFAGNAQITLAQWSFPTSGTVTTPDIYSANNGTKVLTCTQAISNVSGNGTQAASAIAWDNGLASKNWMIEVNTQGFTDIKISSDQRSSNTGPKDFKLQYKIGGGLWNDVSAGNVLLADNFTSGTVNNLSVGSVSDVPVLFIRWIMTSNIPVSGSAVASSGTSRIDNIKVTGTAITPTKPEPSNFPTNFSCGTATSSTIPLSWTDAVGSTLPDGYLIKWSNSSFAAITEPADGIAVLNGSAAQNVAYGLQTFNASVLSPDAPYYFKIWSYTNSGSLIDYKLVGEPQTTCSTAVSPCNFKEDFSNSNATATYSNGSFLGNDAITWTYTQARNENNDANSSGINGKALMLRSVSDNSKIVSSIITSGIGSFSVKLYKGFTGANPRQIEVFINNISMGTSVIFDDFAEHLFTLNNINIPGNIVVELRNLTAGQIIIDDIQWSCFAGTPEPNISIQGNGITITSGNTTPTAAAGTDFGSALLAGTDVEKTFVLQNRGAATLVLGNPAITLSGGTSGFAVSEVPPVNAMTGFTNQNFKIKFNNALPGTYIETVTVHSNDPDTPNYDFQVKATVLQPVITKDKSNLTGFTYALAQGTSAPQNFTVSGSNLGSNLTVTASADWEISTNLTYDGTNTSPFSTIVLPRTSAGIVNNKTIHVRLKDGLPVANYTGTVTLTSLSALTQTVSLSGQVTAGQPIIKVTGNGTSITNGSVTPSGLNNTLFASQNLGNSQTKVFDIKNLGGAPLTVGAITLVGVDASSFSVLNGPAVGTVLNQNEAATFEIKFAPTSIGTKNSTVNIASNDPVDHSYVFALRGGATYCSSAGELIVALQDFEITPALPVFGYTPAPFGAIAPGPNTGFSTGTSGNNAAPKNNKLSSEGSRGYRIQGADPSSEVPSGFRFTFDNVDTSAYTNISLSFKVAGFSLGSTSNGMDDLNAFNTSTSIHADKHDYVLVEVSPDGGITWFLQAKVVSGQLNLPWGFGSSATTEGSRIYAANDNLTYFNSTNTSRYSAVNITNLPAVSNLKIRISAQDNALNESWIIDDVRITSTGLVPKVWDGSAWWPSLPQPSDKAIINTAYNTVLNGGFQVCQCEIKNGTTVTIGENTEIKVSDVLVNNGTVVVEAGGNFTQVNETDTNSGTGIFKIVQELNLSATRQQYSYLISPTKDTNLNTIYKDAFGNPVAVPFVLYHNEATNGFLTSTGAYIKGRALAVKEPTLASCLSTVMSATFLGQPVNGSFTYSLVNSNLANQNRGYNLVGNPYPSNMDLIKFYTDNSGSGNLSPTFYLWDNTANTATHQGGDAYEGQAYATFNAATPAGVGTPLKAFGDPGAAGVKWPTRYVKIAQGFMAKINNTASLNITFSNSIRKPNFAEGFFGKGNFEDQQESVDRYWLKLITPAHLASNMAVVYFAEGNDGFSKEDSRVMGGSDAFYSLVEGEKVSINGKSTFSDSDKVVLGTSHFASGEYTIAIDRREGIFATQNIYLKDTQTGIVTNLTQGDYTFTANAGEIAGRFEIIYQPETVLTTASAAKDDFIVYKDGPKFIMRTLSRTISAVEVYETSGKLISKIALQARTVAVPADTIPKGVYLLRVSFTNGTTVTEKVRN